MKENQQIITPKKTASKPSIVQKRSCGSVRIAFLDRDLAIAQLRENAQRLLEEDERVLAVGLFGSLARGDALPSSDADLLIILSAHPVSRWFDRIPEFTMKFRRSEIAVEVFPYTKEEITRLIRNPGFMRTALREIVPLAGDSKIFKKFSEKSIQAKNS